MKRMLCFFLFLLLTGVGYSMFDLFDGTWRGVTEQGQSLELTTVSSSDHHFRLNYGDEIHILGTYRVTANKGQKHVKFKPERISQSNTDTQQFILEGWTLQVGQESLAIIDYHDNKLSIDRFDHESQFLGRSELTKK
jgi:hypothetical protein